MKIQGVVFVLLTLLFAGMRATAFIEPTAAPIAPLPEHPPVVGGTEKGPAFSSLPPDGLQGNEKITLDLRGMDMANVLKMLSQKSGLKIVAGKDVRGTVNIFLDNIGPRDALKIILEINDLACEEDGGIIKVMTGQEYEKKYGRKYGDRREMRVFQTRYARPDELTSLLSQVKTAGGQLILNNKTNSLIVIDMPDAIRQMEKIMNEVDRNEREVLIEAKIVQVMLNDEYKIGVDWKQVFANVNSIAADASFAADARLGSVIEKGSMGLRGELQVGAVSSDNYSVILSALETVGKTNLLSSPRIAVLNNREARILVGTKEAYVTTTVVTSGTGVSTTAESVTFLDVGMKLYVTPEISSDGFVTLKIRPEVSSVFDTLVTASGNRIPVVRTTETETTVSVKDGTTIIIAGLIEERDMNTRNVVPFLGKIPVLGYLFGGITKSKAKTELVILMTPKIISGAEDILGN